MTTPLLGVVVLPVLDSPPVNADGSLPEVGAIYYDGREGLQVYDGMDWGKAVDTTDVYALLLDVERCKLGLRFLGVEVDELEVSQTELKGT